MPVAYCTRTCEAEYKRTHKGYDSFAKPYLLALMHNFSNKASAATLVGAQAIMASLNQTKLRIRALKAWLFR